MSTAWSSGLNRRLIAAVIEGSCVPIDSIAVISENARFTMVFRNRRILTSNKCAWLFKQNVENSKQVWTISYKATVAVARAGGYYAMHELVLVRCVLQLSCQSFVKRGNTILNVRSPTLLFFD